MKKRRLIDRICEENQSLTPREVEGRILAGLVRVDGVIADKPGMPVKVDAEIYLEPLREHVGRGALKLESALEKFQLSPKGRDCADVGACTGGFTEVLLKHGARRVYAIDVGYGDLAWKLRTDPRVVVMERTNARYVTKLDTPVSLVTIDVSFISLTKILPAVVQWFEDERFDDERFDGSGDVVALVKPQFEAEQSEIGEGGIVRDPAVHQRVVERMTSCLPEVGLVFRGVEPSPILGTHGNAEFLLWSSWEIT